MSVINEPIVYQVYNWYEDIERRLREIVHISPFVKYSDLKKIKSPKLASILLESASLIDAILRDQLPNNFKNEAGKNKSKKEANIKDYFYLLEPKFNFSKSQSLLLSGVPSIFNPFIEWSSPEYKVMPWWQTYNKLKHDRLINSETVTLETCLQATCALNQVMMKIPIIRNLVFRFGWSDPAGVNIEIAVNDLDGIKVAQAYIAYTDFFATFLCHTNYKTDADIAPQKFRNCKLLQALLSRY